MRAWKASLYRRTRCAQCHGTGMQAHLDGAVFRRERLRRKRGLREIAGLVDVSPTHLSDIERGRREASTELARALVRALATA